MKPKLKIEGQRATINGVLTIKHCKDIYQMVKKLTETDVHQVVIDNPTEIDLSVIQILWSFRLSQSRKRNLEVVFILRETDYNLMTRSGFSYFLTPSNNQL